MRPPPPRHWPLTRPSVAAAGECDTSTPDWVEHFTPPIVSSEKYNTHMKNGTMDCMKQCLISVLPLRKRVTHNNDINVPHSIDGNFNDFDPLRSLDCVSITFRQILFLCDNFAIDSLPRDPELNIVGKYSSIDTSANISRNEKPLKQKSGSDEGHQGLFESKEFVFDKNNCRFLSKNRSKSECTERHDSSLQFGEKSISNVHLPGRCNTCVINIPTPNHTIDLALYPVDESCYHSSDCSKIDVISSSSLYFAKQLENRDVTFDSTYPRTPLVGINDTEELHQRCSPRDGTIADERDPPVTTPRTHSVIRKAKTKHSPIKLHHALMAVVLAMFSVTPVTAFAAVGGPAVIIANVNDNSSELLRVTPYSSANISTASPSEDSMAPSPADVTFEPTPSVNAPTIGTTSIHSHYVEVSPSGAWSVAPPPPPQPSTAATSARPWPPAPPPVLPSRKPFRPPPAPHLHQNSRYGPYFEDGESPANVTARVGSTARLDCRVGLLHDKTVTWIHRKEDSIHLLTVGKVEYSSDQRIRLAFRYPSNWRLEILYVTRRDEGLYECQVATHPPRVRQTFLKVTAPEVSVVDESGRGVSERYYKAGSAVELTCVASQLQEAGEPLVWRHGDSVLDRGVSVNASMVSGAVVSTLTVERATRGHSGNYTCAVGSLASVTVAVHVLNGELPAAVQHGSGAGSAGGGRPPRGLCWLSTVAALAAGAVAAAGTVPGQNGRAHWHPR